MNPAVTNKSIVEKRSCLNSVMTMWGWCFDLFTLIVNLSDVISDLLVCHQFAMDKEWVWFGLVLGSLFIGNVAFTSFLFLDNKQPIFKFIKSINVFDQVKFLIILPFAQLIPAVAWTQHQYSLWKKRKERSDDPHPFYETEDKVPAEWAGKINMTTGAGTEEVANVVGSFHAMGRLEGAIKEHLKTHIFFYVETVVESMPQVVIQLLAITFLQKVSAVQVISMSSSLLSIVSKGYVVASSQTISAVVWKFFCCAADLFGLFYIFSSIMDRSAPQEAPLFFSGAPKVTHLTLLFAWKWAIYIAVSAFFGLLLLVFGLLLRTPTFDSKFVKQVLAFVSLGTFLFGPGVIAMEAVKFSTLVLLLTKVEPGYGKAASALMYSYLTTGTSQEKTRKAKNLIYQVMKLSEKKRKEQEEEQKRLTANARRKYYPPIAPPPPTEVMLEYWCDSTSDEEPSDWEDEMSITSELKRRFQVQQERFLAVGACYTTNVITGNAYVFDLANSPEHIIPAGTGYDTYLKLYIGGSASRAERIMRRRLVRKGGEYVDDEDEQKPREPLPQFTPTEINGDEEAPLLSVVASGPSPKKQRRVTKYPHRLPFYISSVDDILSPRIRTQRKFAINLKDTKWENVFLVVLGVIWGFMVVVGQLFSAVFPFVNYGLYHESQNLLQNVCFIGYSFCLFVVLALLIPVLKYGRFNARFQPLRDSFIGITNVQTLFNIIENEHLPTMEALVKDLNYVDSTNKALAAAAGKEALLPPKSHMVKHNILTPELSSLVSSFMQHSDLDLRGVGQREFRRIKEMHR